MKKIKLVRILVWLICLLNLQSMPAHKVVIDSVEAEVIVNRPEELVRGISKLDFIATVSDFANGAKAQIADQAWGLWKKQKWRELEDLFITDSLNYKWPPNRGFIEFSK